MPHGTCLLLVVFAIFCLHTTEGQILVETKNEEDVGLSSTLSTIAATSTDEASDYDYGCNDGEFDCGGGECILESHVCDGIDDCSDGSDELNCENKTHGCTDEELDCGDNSCISINKRCDGFQNCMNAIDELNCPTAHDHVNATSVAITITTEESYYDSDCGDGYQCRDDVCIDKSSLCDGFSDCFDGDDEMECNQTTIKTTSVDAKTESLTTTTELANVTLLATTTVTEPNCNLQQFGCLDGRCIPNRKVCDGTDDCGDYSDEKSCGDMTSALITEQTSTLISKIMSITHREATTLQLSTTSSSCRHQQEWYLPALLATVFMLVDWK